MSVLQAIKTEVIGNPLTRPAYSPWASVTDDQRIADDMNTFYRPGLVSVQNVIYPDLLNTGKWVQYRERAAVITQSTQITQGGEPQTGDPQTTPQLEERAQTWKYPFMREFVDALLAYRDTFQNTRDPYWVTLTDNCVTEGSMGGAARDQFQAISDNKLQRSVEIPEIGRAIEVGEVTNARALP